MKKLFCLGVAAGLFLGGCGSDDSAASGDGGTSGDGATTDGTTGDDGGTTGDGATSHDGGTTGDSGQPMPTVGGLFEQPEPWTKDVSAVAKAGRSDAIIAALVALGGWGNGNNFQIDFSIPLFFATGSTPRMSIVAPGGGYCYGGPDCDAVPFMMPIPAGANIEGSTDLTCDVANGDCHILVVEQQQKKLYELYNSTQQGGSIAALGGFIWDLTKAYPDNLRGDQCTSADAAGFPIAGLLPTADEVAAGEVKHALRFILPDQRMKHAVYVHPGTHAGSPSATNPDAPPYGVRFRLKSTFDETPYSAGAKVILHALKKYGMFLSDGGNIALTFADDRTSTAKWSSHGITAQTFNSIRATDFEVVDLGAEIALTDNCVRNP